MKIKIQEISSPLLKDKDISLFIKRIDQNHKYMSGNKWYKLKYNIISAKQIGLSTILTFGGAYSNHIMATACAASDNGLASIGIIRGEESSPLNPTLRFALSQGMQIKYVDRRSYKLKETSEFLQILRKEFGKFYLIPEGGTNSLAVKGASEILQLEDQYQYICCPVGTGGTISGVINTSQSHQNILGFSAIKSPVRLKDVITSYTAKKNWRLIDHYCCGGYARKTEELIDFIKRFYLDFKIPLDVVYTGKMMMGVMDLIEKDYFPRSSSILVIHTGGIQGNKGMNERLGLSLPL